MNDSASTKARRALARALVVASLSAGCTGDRFAEGSLDANEAGAAGELITAGTGGIGPAAGSGGRGGSAGRGSGGEDSAGRGGSAGSAGTLGTSGQGPAISNGLELWLAADRGVTEEGGGVTRWADSSGNVMDATQGVRDERPRLVSVDGDLPMVEFDGADDSFSLADGFEAFGAGLSFFAVIEVLDLPMCASIVQLSNGPEINDIDFSLANSSIAYEVAERYIPGPPSFDLGQRIIVGVIHRAETDGLAELRVDGEFVAADEPGVPIEAIRYDNFVGRSLYEACGPFEGRIGEILLYDRALEQRERVQVENYLRARWQMPE